MSWKHWDSKVKTATKQKEEARSCVSSKLVTCGVLNRYPNATPHTLPIDSSLPITWSLMESPLLIHSIINYKIIDKRSYWRFKRKSMSIQSQTRLSNAIPSPPLFINFTVSRMGIWIPPSVINFAFVSPINVSLVSWSSITLLRFIEVKFLKLNLINLFLNAEFDG